MRKKFTVALPKGCCVLLTLWNRTAEEVLQHYIDHVSEEKFIERLGLDAIEKSIKSKKEMKLLMNRLVKDPYATATYFFMRYSCAETKT